MAALRINDRGALHLTGADTVQVDPCIELGVSLWLLCVSPHTSLKLQALATSLLQFHPMLQAAISRCSTRIRPALASVLPPLSSVIKDLITNDATTSSIEHEPADDGLVMGIQAQVALIAKDSRCHDPDWIEQDTQNALQPYMRLTRLFRELVMRSRSWQPNSDGEDGSSSVSDTKVLHNEYSSDSSKKDPSTIASQQEEYLSPPGAHTSGSEPAQFPVESRKLTEQLVSTELSAEQIFQALVRRGCQDLTTTIDTSNFSVGAVAGGYFGDIWRGKLKNGTDVAIKVWRLSLVGADDHKILKRLTREIYNWSKAKHTNIHQLLGVIMFQGRVGMVSKWMSNGNLQEYLSRNKSVDRYQLCAQVSKGVNYLHSKSMVHGDLKTANILVSGDGVAMLTDFDHSIISNCSLVFSATTQNGGGTLRWMVALPPTQVTFMNSTKYDFQAPELLNDENSRRCKETDIYALGMTLLEIFTGAIPYHQCRNDGQVIKKVTNKIIPERNAVYFAKEQTGDRVWGFLKKCWDHRPKMRPTATKAVELFYALCPKPASSLVLKTPSNTALLARKSSTFPRFIPHKLLSPVPEEVELPSPEGSDSHVLPDTGTNLPEQPITGLRETVSVQLRMGNKRTLCPPSQQQQVHERRITTPTRRKTPLTSSKPTSTARGASHVMPYSSKIKSPPKTRPCATHSANSGGEGTIPGPSSCSITLSKRPVQPASTTETRTPTKHPGVAPPIARPAMRLSMKRKQGQKTVLMQTDATPLNAQVRKKSSATTPKQGNMVAKLRPVSASNSIPSVASKPRGATMSHADKVHESTTDGTGINPEG